jgi:hypothetical protein
MACRPAGRVVARQVPSHCWSLIAWCLHILLVQQRMYTTNTYVSCCMHQCIMHAAARHAHFHACARVQHTCTLLAAVAHTSPRNKLVVEALHGLLHVHACIKPHARPRTDLIMQNISLCSQDLSAIQMHAECTQTSGKSRCMPGAQSLHA